MGLAGEGGGRQEVAGTNDYGRQRVSRLMVHGHKNVQFGIPNMRKPYFPKSIYSKRENDYTFVNIFLFYFRF